MKKTLQTLLLTLLIDANCSSAITSYNSTNTSESAKSSGVDGIVAAVVAAEAIENPTKECYCLKENEQVLPDQIVETFQSLAGGDRFARSHPAYYFSSKELSPGAKAELDEIKQKFYQKLSNVGYSPEEISVYLAALTQPGGIVIKESVLREPVRSPNSLKPVLEHERIHYEFEKILQPEQEKILSLHQELMKRNDLWRRYSKVEKLVFYDNGFGNSEFVPHLIQNAYFFVENVKTEFPWEYEILLGIKERAKVDTCACDSFKESGMGQKINGQEKIK